DSLTPQRWPHDPSRRPRRSPLVPGPTVRDSPRPPFALVLLTSTSRPDRLPSPGPPTNRPPVPAACIDAPPIPPASTACSNAPPTTAGCCVTSRFRAREPAATA